MTRFARASFLRIRIGWLSLMMGFAAAPAGYAVDVPFEGFIPFVGMGLTDEFVDSTDPNAPATFFIAQPSNSPGGQSLGPGASAYYDLALFDTGAATHILTSDATAGFDIDNEGFDGTNFQPVGGATGIIELRINDPLGVYVGGLADRTGAGSELTMNRPLMRGQTSFATLSAPTAWQLPNIIGMPMAAQHAVHIQNSNPQLFQHQGNTVRTPNIELHPLGSGGQGILRRAELNLNPGVAFVTGPLYIQNLDFTTLELHENPLSPSVIENGGILLDTDIRDGSHSIEDQGFLFDTGASLTVVSSQTAARLGFDPILDQPEFVLSVEGSGGVSSGIPGFIADELTLDTVGGSFTLNDVPLAVLDVTNPSDPGNVVDGIIGMNLFAGRDLVIDANPSIGQGGAPPALYISDPVTTSHAWGTAAATGEWGVAGNWSGSVTPDIMCDATVGNIRGSNQQAVLSADSTIYRATISGSPNAEMAVFVGAGRNLTAFADIKVTDDGRLHLDSDATSSGRVDAQFLQIDGGSLTGTGEVYVGAGPLDGVVRNLGGRISPGDPDGVVVGQIDITGDLSNDGTMQFDLGGRVAGTFDKVEVDRFAFLSGTLEVNLVDLGSGEFNPQIGDTFVLISAGEGVEGMFDDFSLPNGFEWDISYTSNLMRLQVTGVGFIGDFDFDMDIDCDDIDLLTSVVASGSNPATFDLTGDGLVDGDDIEEWVVNQYGTLLGDANLDFVVDTGDFNIWNGNKFTNSAKWCEGDFNGDGSVDISDFNTWNGNKFTSAVDTVPEPTSRLLSMLGLLVAGLCRRKKT